MEYTFTRVPTIGMGIFPARMTATIRPYIPMTPAMTIGMTFFITELGWRIPVFSRLTPAFHVPHFYFPIESRVP